MPAHSQEKKQKKLAKLCEVEGFETLEEFANSSMFGNRSGTPSICMNDDCN